MTRGRQLRKSRTRNASLVMEREVNIQGGGGLLDPVPELPDDTPIIRVQFPTRIHKELVAGGLKTVGEIRETLNETLLNLQDLGSGSVSYLRETLGLPSCDGVRPLEKSGAIEGDTTLNALAVEAFNDLLKKHGTSVGRKSPA